MRLLVLLVLLRLLLRQLLLQPRRGWCIVFAACKKQTPGRGQVRPADAPLLWR
jgi:hypothetical protein